MVNPTRITVAFDKPTADLLEKISTEAQVSQSEIMRRALKFYNENKALEDPATKKENPRLPRHATHRRTHNLRR